jgi:NAD-dependent dihydropyrimidine dehydrogenase PreA subunit
VPYIIAEPCIDVKDRSCVEECPVDCIYEGQRKLYIHPTECVDCGACKTACPMQAAIHEDDLDPESLRFRADNAAFFFDVLPGCAEPLGSPGGAIELGPTGVDTPLVERYPAVSTAQGELR